MNLDAMKIFNALTRCLNLRELNEKSKTQTTIKFDFYLNCKGADSRYHIKRAT